MWIRLIWQSKRKCCYEFQKFKDFLVSRGHFSWSIYIALRISVFTSSDWNLYFSKSKHYFKKQTTPRLLGHIKLQNIKLWAESIFKVLPRNFEFVLRLPTFALKRNRTALDIKSTFVFRGPVGPLFANVLPWTNLAPESKTVFLRSSLYSTDGTLMTAFFFSDPWTTHLFSLNISTNSTLI